MLYKKTKKLLPVLILTAASAFCPGLMDNPTCSAPEHTVKIVPASKQESVISGEPTLQSAAIYMERSEGEAGQSWMERLKPVASEIENGTKLVKEKPKPLQVASAISRGGERRLKTVAMSVPSTDVSFKSYMDYRAITNRSSWQWKLQQQAVTDGQGFRKLGDDYLVALGTYYVKGSGERFRITFASGRTITVTVGDIKSNRHTNETRQYCPRAGGGGNMIEFIIDRRQMSREALRRGDISCLGMAGTVTAIEKIVP